MNISRQLAMRFHQGNQRFLTHRQNLIDFASNDTLGFAKNLTPIISSEKKWGSTGSRLLTGNSQQVEELESRLAQFHKCEAGLLFSSGYLANLGLLSCLPQTQDLVLYDAHIHASMRDGIRLCSANSFHFRHNDLSHLKELLIRPRNKQGAIYICVESLYSCDGTCAPLKEIVSLCQDYGALLIVDEAHATGVYGPQGAGFVQALGLQNTIYARIHTFSKAVGVCGAIVLGNQDLKDYLINFSRPFIFTTALPFPILKAIEAAYNAMENSDLARIKVQDLINQFTKGIHSLGITTLSSSTHIQAIPIPGNEKARIFSEYLEKAGFDVRPLMHPTIPRGTERLRICLHAYNTSNEVFLLLNEIKRGFFHVAA